MKISVRAFTLVELLVVVAIIGVLVSLAFSASQSMLKSARSAAEISAGRTLIAAYLAGAQDNGGILLAGYDDKARGYTHPALGPISDAAAHRYPYRLAPYFDYGLNGTILVNRNASQIKRFGFPSWEYGVSLCPALGMNAYFVGGSYELGVLDMPGECATRLAQVGKPSSMLVFASAGMGSESGGDKVDGFHRVEPPAKHVDLWTGPDDAKDVPPASYGNVDFRYNGRAVCVFLDGSIRLLAPKDLRDMRLWNKNAQDSNNPNYRVPIAPPPPGRGNGR